MGKFHFPFSQNRKTLTMEPFRWFLPLSNQCFHGNTPVNPHKVIDGFVWAKALYVSDWLREIYGSLVESKWLKGTVVEILSNRGKVLVAKRVATVIKAVNTVGTSESTRTLNLQILKSSKPSVVPPPFGIPQSLTHQVLWNKPLRKIFLLLWAMVNAKQQSRLLLHLLLEER
jgi:hypothetical protein